MFCCLIISTILSLQSPKQQMTSKCNQVVWIWQELWLSTKRLWLWIEEYYFSTVCFPTEETYCGTKCWDGNENTGFCCFVRLHGKILVLCKNRFITHGVVLIHNTSLQSRDVSNTSRLDLGSRRSVWRADGPTWISLHAWINPIYWELRACSVILKFIIDRLSQ